MKKNRHYSRTYRKIKPKVDYDAIIGSIRIASQIIMDAVQLHMVLSTPKPKHTFREGGLVAENGKELIELTKCTVCQQSNSTVGPCKFCGDNICSDCRYKCCQ
jgi:hypothetical protein